MALFQPVRSVHSLSSHVHKALGHAGAKLKELAQTAAHGALIGGTAVAAAGALVSAHNAYKNRPKWQRY